MGVESMYLLLIQRLQFLTRKRTRTAAAIMTKFDCGARLHRGDGSGAYLRSDQGRSGALDTSATFIILGDLNADPLDGSGRSEGIRSLLASPRINASTTPRSEGGKRAAASQGRKNMRHQGDPTEDTGDFNDSGSGNLRCDFVLPRVIVGS